jgi:hypothetical protein
LTLFSSSFSSSCFFVSSCEASTSSAYIHYTTYISRNKIYHKKKELYANCFNTNTTRETTVKRVIKEIIGRNERY